MSATVVDWTPEVLPCAPRPNICSGDLIGRLRLRGASGLPIDAVEAREE